MTLISNKKKILIMLCLLANTLYITPIWAQASQSSDSTKISNATTSVSILNGNIKWFDATDNQGKKLTPVYNNDGSIIGYHDTNGEAVALNQVILTPSEQVKDLITLEPQDASKTVTVRLTQKGQEQYNGFSQKDKDTFLDNMANDLFSEYSNVAQATFMNDKKESVATYFSMSALQDDNTNSKLPVEDESNTPKIPETNSSQATPPQKGNSNFQALK
jgi:hypothetical protein